MVAITPIMEAEMRLCKLKKTFVLLIVILAILMGLFFSLERQALFWRLMCLVFPQMSGILT